MTRSPRNASCSCGSGKKYKKCCLEKDAAELVDLMSSGVIEFRAAALEFHGHGYVPAITCCDRHRKCSAVLAYPEQCRDAPDAADCSLSDLALAPRAPGLGTVTKDRLIYLYGVGYRIIPGVSDGDIEVWDDLFGRGADDPSPHEMTDQRLVMTHSRP